MSRSNLKVIENFFDLSEGHKILHICSALHCDDLTHLGVFRCSGVPKDTKLDIRSPEGIEGIEGTLPS